MLKALELTGFKSFADRTRFEFPAGITVVVGPNGSGKSNIVDAIKWVLGEQSAKSLRGKEMADVIFKGAGGPNGRKPANSATATLILDNTDRRFSFDTDEVQVSRRVYRSGESEYLINNEAARLRDIRDMFRGTGIGTDSYSLIEQGKVDRLLQASAKERRAIFEEAAGISRFKAKKIEAQRRLERVEGNLVRLADIVEEVGSRYRSVKNQASKAAKYREYSQRLQELRTSVGLKDWRSLSDKMAQLESDNAEFIRQSEELKTLIAESEKQADSIEHQLEEFSAEVAGQQQRASACRENITQHSARMELNRTRAADLESRRKELESQIGRLTARLEEVETRQSAIHSELSQSDSTVQQSRDKLENLETDLADIDANLEDLLLENEKSRSESNQLITLISELGRMVSAADSQIESLRANETQAAKLISDLEANLADRKAALVSFQQQKRALELDAESKNSDLARARNEFDQARQVRADLAAKQVELNNTLTGKSQRRKVLVELEKRLEGVDAGARQLLEQAKKSASGPYREIVAVVADMITVNVQHAGIVDVALGNAAQYIVVNGHELLSLLAEEKLRVKGRVGFIQLDDPPTLGADPDISINGEPGVIGRADRLVQVNPEYARFVRRLLGGTWIVRTLADAISLHHRKLGRIRLVTLDGEIVESDGAIIVGPKAVVTGLVSRKSELRMLAVEIEELGQSIDRTGQQLVDSNLVEQKSERRVQELINENSNLARQLGDILVRSEGLEKQIEESATNLKQARTEHLAIGKSMAEVAFNLSGNRENLLHSESRLESLGQATGANDAKGMQLRNRRQDVERNLTHSKIALAKSEQHFESLDQQQQQIGIESQQLSQELARYRDQQTADLEAYELATVEITAASKLLQTAEAELSGILALLDSVTTKKIAMDGQRRDVAQRLRTQRDGFRDIQDRLHKAELKNSHLQMERTRLAERLQEDYGIDIAVAAQQPTDEEELAQRDVIDNEISELRKKIGSIGSVNMDALAELEDLEQRYTKMDEQYQDLVAAKRSLENIIQRINSDSRRLFVETLDAIRGNFQSLFRQTFGGGKADVVLEEGVDPLEAGVEIIATPPGKPEFNNSLLSGGEKALTAVSLLMAIFQFRPSPFCVLDEVDAPFDEANIGRFIEVLKSFLGWTKFVIVTHSKKTMTAATTLYGVTMQESGVSKRVSVRFEDVSDDGNISASGVHPAISENERGVA